MIQISILELYLKSSRYTRAFIKGLCDNIHNLTITNTMDKVNVMFYIRPEYIVLDNIQKVNNDIKSITKRDDYISISMNGKYSTAVDVCMDITVFNSIIILSQNNTFNFNSAINVIDSSECRSFITEIKDSFKSVINKMGVSFIVKEVLSNKKYSYVCVYVNYNKISNDDIESMNKSFKKSDSSMFHGVVLSKVYSDDNCCNICATVPFQLYVCCVIAAIE